MKKRILRYIKHVLATVFILMSIGLVVIVNIGGAIHYSDDPKMRILDKDGPYVFYQNDSILSVNYIRGNKNDGFYTEKEKYNIKEDIKAQCYFPLEKSTFDITITSKIEKPKAIYNDKNPIIAVSDIESGFKAFRDFLIYNKIIDKELNWIFEKGHLVLVGDFVDRGNSTTQILWFIYKLEQEAKKHGGVVHYILGNHELKNMQDMFGAASQKYYAAAAILDKQHHELYNATSFLGKWLASKNTIEVINGNIFTHGGIHPEIAAFTVDIEKINAINSAYYDKVYYPTGDKNLTQLITSNRKGICWYRGYFKDELAQEQIDEIVTSFKAKTIVVGHTIQSKVKRSYNGKIIGIDVKHPKDYQYEWPKGRSEGLLIENEKYYRILDNGDREEI